MGYVLCFIAVCVTLIIAVTLTMRRDTCPKCKDLSLVREIEEVSKRASITNEVTRCTANGCGYRKVRPASAGMSAMK